MGGLKNFPSNSFYFCCDVNRDHSQRKKEMGEQRIQRLQKSTLVNGTNKYLGVFTQIQMTSKKSVSQLQESINLLNL